VRRQRSREDRWECFGLIHALHVTPEQGVLDASPIAVVLIVEIDEHVVHDHTAIEQALAK
jgi:hypothetical protein